MIRTIYSDELYHFGIKGQKWGIRRYQNPDGTLTEEGKRRIRKVNDNVYLVKQKGSPLARGLAKMSKKIKEEQEKDTQYKIMAGEKVIGDLELYKESADSLNITWIGIKSKERGKKYAQSVMDWIIRDSKDSGYKQLTLEVPGISPDARHIYEKKGFVDEGVLSDEDDVWGGLTKMRRTL